ncbi:MAG: type II toxin-antitoxin system HicA family toxin [Saprospiraceae bacterium]|nr:type II toxin-antitoxin system HicA family toxin [Saprospiraceae bacterium]MBL0294814.1 type II toxin-antitoxin system HicA family toxin [Saprospiraceae bacterium]
MTKLDKILFKILNGLSDNNIDFTEFLNLLMRLGFEMRIKGSHHILSKDGVEEIINIQGKNGKAKPYQIKQVREIIIKYGLNSYRDE